MDHSPLRSMPPRDPQQPHSAYLRWLIAAALVLLIGLGALESMDVARAQDAPTATPTRAAASPTASSYEYTVQAGDSWGVIAREVGLSVRQLMADNPQLLRPNDVLRVGDVLTITLEERTQASKKTDSKSSKKSEIAFDEGTLLGSTISAGNLSMVTNTSQERSAEGEADAGQSNSLSGNISVTVAEVLPNGLLRIRGEKWLTLAEGDEYIRLSGLVRPEDISIDNSVLSTKIADARIAYSATGAFASVNRQGWLSEFFNSEWWPL